jgi:hypothetical protein
MMTMVRLRGLTMLTSLMSFAFSVWTKLSAQLAVIRAPAIQLG